MLVIAKLRGQCRQLFEATKVEHNLFVAPKGSVFWYGMGMRASGGERYNFLFIVLKNLSL